MSVKTKSEENPDIDYLIDNQYTFKSLIDVDRLRILLEKFSKATGFTTGLVSHPDQELLIKTGWRDICTKFHRVCPESSIFCKNSNIYLTKQLKKLCDFNIKHCENGLVDGATPIIIEGKHVANLFTGQIFFEPPDLDKFKNQAKKFGFDSTKYLEQVKQVPIVSEETFVNALDFLSSLAVEVAEQGLSNLKTQKEFLAKESIKKELSKSNKKYKDLTEVTSDWIWEVDQNMIYTYASPKSIDIFGYDSTEVEGTSPFDYMTDEDSKELIKTVPDLFKQQKPFANLINRVFHKDGSIKVLETSGVPIFDDKNNFIGFRGIDRDITDRYKSEQQMRNEKLLIETVIESLPGIFYIYDLEGNMLRWNRNFPKVSEYSDEELSGMKAIDFFSKDDAPYAKEKITSVFENGEDTMENYFYTKTRKRIPYYFTGKRFKTNGETLLVGTAIDMTEQKKINNDLRASEERYRLLAENVTDVIWTRDLDFKMTYVSPSVETQRGFTPEEIMNQSIDEMMPPESAITAKQIIKTALKHELEIHPPKPQTTTVDLEMYCKDGSTIWVAINFTFYRDKNEKTLGFLAISRNITERKLAEDELSKSQKWLATTLNSVGDAVITTDTKGNVTFLNPVAQELTGWKLDDAKGLPLPSVFKIINMNSRKLVDTPVDKVLKTQKTVTLANHTVLIAKDGSENPISDSGAPIIDNTGKILGVVLVFRDMTEQYKKEAHLRQHQKLESIGTLAGGVAHEINNPVGIIMNYGEIILDETDKGSGIQQFAKEIISESQRIANIVKNLLSFSRQDRETHSPALVNDIIDSTLALVNKLVKKDQVIIKVKLDDDLPKIRCRSQQIMQVLLNLVTNAKDALNEKYPGYDENKVVEIASSIVQMKGRPWIRITVEDKGNGIPDTILNKLFDPFFTTKRQDKGTGLGLSVSHGIIKDHNGKLSIETELNKFSRFTIDLPTDPELLQESQK